MRLPLLFLLAPSFSMIAFAAPVFIDDFDYPEGELESVSSGRWLVAVDNGNPHLEVVAGALEWDFTGGSADPVNNGWYGANVSGSKFETETLYAHFNLTVNEAPAIDGSEAGMFAGFWNGGAGIRARLWLGIGKDGSGNPIADTFRLGLTESKGSRDDVVWADENIAEGTTVRVVIKYDMSASVAYLYVNAADESDVAATVDDGSTYGLNGFGFRHKDDGDLGRFQVDDLAISLGFEDVSADPPSTPEKVSAHAVPGEKIFLTWKDLSTNETGFLIERSVADGDFTEVATTTFDVAHYVDEDVTVGPEYCYRVSALGSPSSDPSASTCATVAADPVVTIAARPRLESNDGALVLALDAQRLVSHRLLASTDLTTWDYQGMPLGGVDDALAVDLATPSDARFYQLESTVFPVPADIGLNEPFLLPQNGGGSVIDVTDRGATPDDDSNNDTVGFISAMAVAQAGDTVYVPAGTYHLRSPVTIKSGVILRGEDRDTTRLVADLATGLSAILRIDPGASDITISDLSLDARTGELTDAVLVGSPSGAVVERVWIHRLRIEHHSRRGVLVRQARHVKVEDCRILNATDLGDGGHGYGIVFNDPENNNNWATGNLIGPVIRHGILIQYEARNNLVEHNTIYNTTEDAIDLHGEDESRNEVRFNLAFWDDPSGWDGTPVGIGVGNTGATHDDTGPFNWIHHNEVYGYYAGLEVILDSHHQYIDGNYFHDNVVAGIQLYNGGGDGIVIRGNLLHDNGPNGIRIESSNAVRITDNEINGHDTGVKVAADSSDYDIERNDLTGNTMAADLATTNGTYTDNQE